MHIWRKRTCIAGKKVATPGVVMAKRRKNLSDKQRAFVEHYLESWNATKAARRAGYRGNSNTLAVVGWENLRKPKISAEIERRISEKAMRADEVLLRLGQQARANITDVLSFSGAQIIP